MGKNTNFPEASIRVVWNHIHLLWSMASPRGLVTHEMPTAPENMQWGSCAWPKANPRSTRCRGWSARSWGAGQWRRSLTLLQAQRRAQVPGGERPPEPLQLPPSQMCVLHVSVFYLNLRAANGSKLWRSSHMGSFQVVLETGKKYKVALLACEWDTLKKKRCQS